MLSIILAAAFAVEPPAAPAGLANCRDARGRISMRCLPKGTVVTGPAPATLEPAPARACRDRRHKVIVCPKKG